VHHGGRAAPRLFLFLFLFGEARDAAAAADGADDGDEGGRGAGAGGGAAPRLVRGHRQDDGRAVQEPRAVPLRRVRRALALHVPRAAAGNRVNKEIETIFSTRLVSFGTHPIPTDRTAPFVTASDLFSLCKGRHAMSELEGNKLEVPSSGSTFVFQAGSNPTFYVHGSEKLEQLMKEYLVRKTQMHAAAVDRSGDTRGTGTDEFAG
jgi:hypothetical protein